MNYKMYDEMMEQPESLSKTFKSEFSKMEDENVIFNAEKMEKRIKNKKNI